MDEPGREPVQGFSEATIFPQQPNIMPVWDTTDISDSGTIGYATRADPKKGKKIIKVAVDRIVAFVEKVATLNSE